MREQGQRRLQARKWPRTGLIHINCKRVCKIVVTFRFSCGLALENTRISSSAKGIPRKFATFEKKKNSTGELISQLPTGYAIKILCMCSWFSLVHRHWECFVRVARAKECVCLFYRSYTGSQSNFEFSLRFLLSLLKLFMAWHLIIYVI